MARRRSRSRRAWPTAVLACVVILLGVAVVQSGGWAPVVIAAVFAGVMVLLTGRRTRRRVRR